MAVTRSQNTVKMTASGDSVTDNFFINGFLYYNASASETVELQDTAGNPLFEWTEHATNETGGQSIGGIRVGAKGIKAAALTGGEVIIYHE